ncbi:MAG TPA: DoxX family protein [Opitutaceae bacterium]|nr:DoxX family protein [Opitutaceae bacterium]
MKISALYARYATVVNYVQAPLLLVIRLYWGLQWVQTGWGKLSHFSRTVAFFTSLGLPLPQLNAALASGTELCGGVLLAVGLGARLAALPLVFTMFVAYATAEHEALAAIFRDPDKFTAATPFLFLYAVLLVLAFGPGFWSLDHWLGRRQATG